MPQRPPTDRLVVPQSTDRLVSLSTVKHLIPIAVFAGLFGCGTASEIGTASKTESETASETATGTERETASETGTATETETASATDPGPLLPCDDLGGYAAGSPWPTWQGCPSRAGPIRPEPGGGAVIGGGADVGGGTIICGFGSSFVSACLLANSGYPAEVLAALTTCLIENSASPGR